MRLIILSFLLWQISFVAIAQDSLMYAVLPDSIVITATRYEENARLVGQRIAVWNADDIARLPVSSFDELMRTTAGVEVFSRSGFGVQSDITIRGGTFNGVLVLIDGVRFNDAQTGHFLSDFPIPLSQIERIEVLRGPASVVYGPDALNGVIHVITRGATQFASSEKTKVSVTSRLGSHQLREYSGDVLFHRQSWSAGGGAVFQSTAGETIEDVSGAIMGPNGIVKTDFERFAHAVFFRTHHRPVQVYTRLAMDWRDFNAYHFYTVSSLDFSRESTRTTWGQVRVTGEFSPSTSWAINSVAKIHKDVFDFNPQFAKNNHTSQHIVLRMGLRHEANEDFSISSGLSGWSRKIDSNNLGNHSDLTIGGYTQARYQPLDEWVVYSGVRLDHDGAFGTELTPQLNSIYRIGRWALRANIGRAVRAPNYVEQYINFTRPPQRGRNYGNPDLRVEKAWSKEAGVDFYPNKQTLISATFFQRKTSNLIDFAQLNPVPDEPVLADSVLLAQNVASVNTEGLEIDLIMKERWGNHSFDFASSFTRIATDLDKLKAGAVFKYASNHARTILQSTVQWRFSPVQLSIQAFWKERADDNNYGIINARASFAIPLKSNQLNFSIDARNLLNVSYSEVLDAPMPGRWILFGISYRS